MITEKNKDEYTWALFSKDLTLCTHLTHTEAFNLAYELKKIDGLNPFDCFEIVRQIVRFLKVPIGDREAANFGAFLAQLIKEAKHKE